MLTKLNEWRKRHFPTSAEAYQQGILYAQSTMMNQPFDMALISMDLPMRIEARAFDRGVLDAVKQAQRNEVAGYDGANTIIKTSPLSVAVQVIEKYIDKSDDPHYARGMRIRLNKEFKR